LTITLLSRHAESVFWLGRYLELAVPRDRGEFAAQILDPGVDDGGDEAVQLRRPFGPRLQAEGPVELDPVSLDAKDPRDLARGG
jgi:hypothetical protein